MHLSIHKNLFKFSKLFRRAIMALPGKALKDVILVSYLMSLLRQYDAVSRAACCLRAVGLAGLQLCW